MTAFPTPPPLKAQHGFSLVELSIVLVILGLLTGGILAGQSLIRASELRSISSDLQRYTAAVYSFQSKYNAFPGDMPNAVRFWGAQAGGTADGLDAACTALTNVPTPATGSATCNGNGDGRINSHTEQLRAWQHLANAGLVEGKFSGVSYTAGNNQSWPGENVPQMKIANVGISVMAHSNPTTDSGSWFANSGSNLFSVGKPFTSGETRIGFLKPEEAWGIDLKMDDGRPAQGMVHNRRQDNCTTTLVSTTAEYLLTGTEQGCIIRAYLR